MSRNLLFKLFGAVVVLVAAVLWILSLTVPETFGFFSLAWAGVLVCGGLGLVLLLQGIFQCQRKPPADRSDPVRRSPLFWQEP